ncbi:hypothetical protein OPIT5_07475 [Opitutaceae bacterium TAV5]|nr:hypothetical protein OPIT5_07475 [Opitutaceae bacterium TAV5]
MQKKNTTSTNARPYRKKSAAGFRCALPVAGLSIVLAAPPLRAGDDTPPDKSACTLFNPTPKEWMRALSTDRPDQTESPYTVDAGHVQIELDFVNYTYDSDGGIRTREYRVAPLNLKVGLLNHVDLQLMVDPYIRSQVKDRNAGTRTTVSGSGDLTTRLKINLWGNDGGATALGIMPFVKWPLSSNDIRNGKTEGGVIVPFAAGLPADWSMGAMTEVDFVSDGDGGYDTEWVNSITFSHDITGKLGGYIEFVAVTGSAPGFRWQGQVDIGFTWALGENSQLDFGCNFGVTDSAPDYQPFAGFSRRF